MGKFLHEIWSHFNQKGIAKKDEACADRYMKGDDDLAIDRLRDLCSIPSLSQNPQAQFPLRWRYIMRSFSVLLGILLGTAPAVGQLVPRENLKPNSLSPQRLTPPSFSEPGTLSQGFRLSSPKSLVPLSLPRSSPPMNPRVKKFDYHSVQMRRNKNHWELIAGNQVLKDFGESEKDAREAVRLIHSLRLTEHGTVGHLRPIMEYWLSKGQAPFAFSTLGLRTLPIDSQSLRTENVFGQWVVRDDQRVFFNFGIRQQEAQQAVQVIRQHEFARIGFVGHPKPSLIYFLGDDQLPIHKTGFPKPPQVNQPKAPKSFLPFSPGQKNPNTPTPVQKSLAVYYAVQQLGRGYRQLAPAVTEDASRIRFDPGQVKLSLDKLSWKLTCKDKVLVDFGSDYYQGQQVLKWIQLYGCNEQRVIGQPDSTFSYFLVNGAAPRGIKFSMQGQPLRADQATIKRVKQTWYLHNNGQPLFPIGEQKQDAEEVLQALERFQFDFVAWPTLPSAEKVFPFLIRSR